MDTASDQVRNAIVLVVEDSPVQAALLKDFLSKTGLQILWAPNGVECLKLVHQVEPNLIVLDLEMPKMGGLETCEALKNNPKTAHIPIILFTRYDEPELMKAGLKSGAVDFIPKDAFADAVLLETLKQMGLID